MMEIEIISVGTELALGQVVNTNTAYLADQLTQLDLAVTYQTTIADKKSVMVPTIQQALCRAQLVFICGGLGPTDDDITMATVASALGTRLQVDQQHWEWIQAKFKQRQIAMEPENIQQAQYLVGGKPLANPVGLALGCWYQSDQGVVVVLPGPPAEFKAMVKESLLPMLKQQYSTTRQITSRTLNFLGRPESLLMDEIKATTKGMDGITITSYVQPTSIQVRLTVRDLPIAAASQLINQAQEKILAVEGPYYFGTGDNLRLVDVVVAELKKRHWKITAAESLTGGLFQSTICSVPGASSVFNGGFVTYAAEAKEELLAIPEKIIDKYGVVSAEVAKAMAQHACQRMKATVGISFTGVAGPDSLENHPAGTVWLGLAIKGQKVLAKELHLAAYSGRQAIRQLSVQYGLQFLLTEMTK